MSDAGALITKRLATEHGGGYKCVRCHTENKIEKGSKAMFATALALAEALRPVTKGSSICACDKCKALADWDKLVAEIASVRND